MNETKFEPDYLSPDEFIFAKNQSQSTMVDPSKIFSVGEHGEFVKKKLPSEKQIISTYWAKRTKMLSIIMFLSAGLMFIVLLQTSGILDQVFVVGVNTLMATFSVYMGLLS